MEPRNSSPCGLARFPFVLRELASRGGEPQRRPQESAEAFQLRVETELMALFRDTGSERAFEALYESARRSLSHWIVSCLRGRCGHDPLEILQDTFVNIYRYARSFRAERDNSFRVWSRTIAANIVRRASMGRSQPSLEALPEGLREPEDGKADPQVTVQCREERRDLERAWALLLLEYAAAWEKLSERDRRALTLVEVDDCTYVEAGRILQVGRSNMKMIIFRARKRIRERMRGALSPAPAETRRIAG